MEKKEEKKEIVKLSIEEKLSLIQSEIKVPKKQHNSFGNYNFRSCEDILEAIKPILSKYGVLILLSDEICVFGNNEPVIVEEEYFNEELKRIMTKKNIINAQRFYIKSEAKIVDVETSNSISNYAYAREEENKKGMDSSQITGTASSYARKYALNGLLALDDVKDADDPSMSKLTDNDNQESTISLQEAENYIFPGGKCKGKKLKDVMVEDEDYIDWLVTNKKDNPTLKKCIEIIEQSNEKKVDRLDLLKEMKDLELKTNSSHEKILETYGVKSDTEMSSEQIQDAIKTLKKYIPEVEKEMTPYDF